MENKKFSSYVKSFVNFDKEISQAIATYMPAEEFYNGMELAENLADIINKATPNSFIAHTENFRLNVPALPESYEKTLGFYGETTTTIQDFLNSLPESQRDNAVIALFVTRMVVLYLRCYHGNLPAEERAVCFMSLIFNLYNFDNFTGYKGHKHIAKLIKRFKDVLRLIAKKNHFKIGNIYVDFSDIQ